MNDMTKNDILRLRTRLSSLAIFRNLLKSPVMEAFLALLSDCGQGDTAAAVSCYCDFVSQLYRHGDNFSDYLLNFVLEDENSYMLAKCTGRSTRGPMEEALDCELSLLQELCALGSDQLKQAMGYDGFLPGWNTSSFDLGAIYHRRIADIHTKGYGIFAKYHMFAIDDGQIVPIRHPDPQRLDQLSDYEAERNKVIKNTQALLQGGPASNVLLYGDAGTGKSSTVKAIVNAYKDQGLRMIEVKKKQLYQIPDIVEALSANPLKFILFIDDLSFTGNDDDFAALKAILEGSISGKSSNLAIYATSNRRHLVKETMTERSGDELHLNDTMQELMSLSARFGLIITYQRPDKQVYCSIVQNLAKQYGIEMDAQLLLQRAEAHAIRANGRSPRTAKQFIELLKTGIIPQQ